MPKHHAPPIEITKPRQFNNGNIDVIHPQYTTAISAPSVPVDEVLINGRRYRVPEKVIILDFWNKLNKCDEHIQRYGASFVEPLICLSFIRDEIASGMSSPLTELSSLDDEDDLSSQPSQVANDDFDDHSAAEVSSFITICFKFRISVGSLWSFCKTKEQSVQRSRHPWSIKETR